MPNTSKPRLRGRLSRDEYCQNKRKGCGGWGLELELLASACLESVCSCVVMKSDGVLGANGNKWEAHSGATAPGQFCAFDTAQGRAVRDFYTDFANEVV